MTRFDRLTAAVVSFVLFAGGLLVVTEVLIAAFDREPLLLPSDDWGQTLRTTTWEQPSFRFIVIAVMTGAVISLWLQFRPRGRGTWQLGGSTPALLIARRDLERLLTRSVANVGEVERAHLRLGARKLRVRVETAGSKSSVGQAKTAVRTAVTEAAARLGVVRPPKVKIKAYPRGEVV